MTTEPEDDGSQDSSEGGSDDKINDPLTQSDEGEKTPKVEWGHNPSEED